MNTRILHCGENLANYYICIDNQVVGFSKLSKAQGDKIYISVKVNGINYIGAKGIIDSSTNIRPWSNSQNYKFIFKLTNIEYCKPFNIQPISQFGGIYWGPKYLVGSKPINDEGSVIYLNDQFEKNKIPELHRF